MKLWLLSLALSVLLCGCEINKPDETILAADDTLPTETILHNQPEETTMPRETEPEGWPEGSVEAQTNGALLSWQLPDRRIAGIRFMGKDLLAFFDRAGYTELQLLSVDDMRIKSSIELKDYVTYSQQSWVATEDKFAYFSKDQNAVIILDAQFTQVRSIPVLKKLSDQVVITQDLKTVYYSKGGGIYSLDLESGESTFLANTGGYVVHIDLLFDDTVLSYMNESLQTGYLSTLTGQVIGSDNQIDDIATSGDRYFLSRVSDDYNEYLFGTFGEEQTALVPKKSMSYSCQGYLPNCHGVVLRGYPNGYDIDKVWAFFDYYDLTTGKRIAAMDLNLGDVGWFSTVIEDPSGNYLWFATRSTYGENTKLYRWEFGATQTNDEQVYTGRRFTESEPDLEGIERCRERADAMGETYGVEILLYDEARFPQGYGFQHLYQANIIDENLDRLEKALASFPEGFFETLGTISQNGKIQFSIARRTAVNYDYYYDCMLHWDNGNACISMKSGSLNGSLVYRGVGYILEAFLRNTGYLESWDSYNPEGFRYYGSFEAAKAGTHDRAYFIDQKSMASRSTDVAVLFEYAMLDDNETYMKRYIMQKKLELLCQSIREAFNFTENAETLPWEKYLEVTE